MANKMRIQLVGPVPPPYGGMSNQLQQLNELLTAEGFQVEVTPVNSPYKPLWVGKLKGVRALFRFVPYFFALWRRTSDTDVSHIFANSGLSWHFFAAPAIWIAWIQKKGVLLHYHGGEAEQFFRHQIRYISPSIKRCTKVVVPSGFLEDIFNKYNVETAVIPNVIDMTKFCHSSKMHKTASSSLQLLVPRNLDPVYDVATAIKAFNLVKEEFEDIRLLVTGIGPELEMLEKLVLSLGLQEAVEFTGKLTNTQMADLYTSVDIVLNPSLADNLPVSLLESLASGIPVITTNVGGIPYLIENNRNGLLVSPGNVVEMANAIKRLIGNASLRENLINNGLDYVKQYEWKSLRSKWLKAYAEVLDSQQNTKSKSMSSDR